MIDAVTIQEKYGGRTPPPVPLPDRQWPSRTMTKCPQFLSHDLRDGNQALPVPMTFDQKVVIFKQLVSMGFREIELGFVGASKTDHDFVRYVVETPGLVPDDVCIQVCSPCRKEALLETVKLLHGAKKANIFTYIGCSNYLREIVLGMTEDEWIERARSCAAYVRSLVKDNGPYAEGTEWAFSFGFEDFSNAQVESVVRCAEAVKSAWKPTVDDKMVLGVAASVEVSPPNVFADRVEYLLKRISDRETYRFGVHPHNDRGCARGGNVDIIVVAANAMTLGLDPGVDLSRLDEVAKIYADITGIPVHPRTPYAGAFYFRAFSGFHQDAVSKGLKVRKSAAPGESWKVPYLPLDPADVGRDIGECVVGITSQSGKSGTAWVLRQNLGICHIPCELLRVFQKIVQQLAEQAEEECKSISAHDVCQAFCDLYHVKKLGENAEPAFLMATGGSETLKLDDILSSLDTNDLTETHAVLAPLLNLPKQTEISVQYESLDESATQALQGSTVAYAKLTAFDTVTGWGVGVGGGEAEASIRAVLSACIVTGHLQLCEREAKASTMSGRHIDHRPLPSGRKLQAVETI
ncbi:2-isopropylmalate synthase [Colletotrichum navitas]|uniref:2-isopropylmalate synthase n=1 Tax=Colletotrichum navitas TaxID=681940 RepID=A0AAD8UYY8_9PEZI|nr:2-isopropylmalate synthase [Colletotrichum navitas]KAK1573058.1 2-isopropylmalate synthase [Colletotrichum navitas]